MLSDTFSTDDDDVRGLSYSLNVWSCHMQQQFLPLTALTQAVTFANSCSPCRRNMDAKVFMSSRWDSIYSTGC